MKVSALDESNKPVDWWFIYKVPQLGAGAGTDTATGYEYVYYDATMDANPDRNKRMVVKSPNVLNGGKGALNFTLDSVFKNFKKPAATTGWILYNDEMPPSANRKDDVRSRWPPRCRLCRAPTRQRQTVALVCADVEGRHLHRAAQTLLR